MNIEKGEAKKNIEKELDFAKEEYGVRKKLSKATPASGDLQDDVNTTREQVKSLERELGIRKEGPDV